MEAKVGLLEARLNERSHPSHPPTADQSTVTDISVNFPPAPVETQSECQQSILIHPSGDGDFISTSGHLDNDDLGFPSAASTPFIDRTRPADITGDSAYLSIEFVDSWWFITIIHLLSIVFSSVQHITALSFSNVIILFEIA